MADPTNPLAICPICWKPLADLPAVLRQGDKYVRATCWTGEEPVEKATAEADVTPGRRRATGARPEQRLRVLRVSQRRGRCPHCGSTSVLRLIYGLPDEELRRAAEEGKVALGGCSLSENDPSRICNDCGWTWGKGRALGG